MPGSVTPPLLNNRERASLGLGTGTREILAPGRGMTDAARALAGARRRVGVYPYQWLWPGPNSKHVLLNGQVLIDSNTFSGDVTLINYTVPQGMRFALRGLFFTSNSPIWQQGSGQIIMRVMVEGVGVRPVDWLQNFRFPIGSFEQPWPLDGRLEFNALTNIQMIVGLALDSGDDGGYVAGRLMGHTYPQSESGDD